MISTHPEASKHTIRPAAAFLRIAGAALGTGVLLAVLGYLPTAAAAGGSAVPAMLTGVAVAVFGGWAGTLASLVFINRPPVVQAWGVLGGLAARFAVTVTLAIAIGAGDVVARTPLMIWVAIAQLAILGVDTFGLIRLVRGGAGSGRAS
jgi:hypothetical protein